MREEFEAWAEARRMRLGRDGVVVDYANPHTDLAWNSWKASREALVIELPDDAYLNRESVFVQGYFEGVRLTKEAIEATGVKVKP